ncbi:hypothetical protein FXN61_00470 [Lentzea sp. PSKA42]|uniref:Uncharacterized protein n=1 Tax=Lentzea indica TaxID=2604800 RepID=A0ABX1F9F4_9PSEU|nr:hypothetical protein [Lentzea indica]NKE55381.1 hypothetical protein [Lentzea indica]
MTAVQIHELPTAALAIPQPRGEVRMYELGLVAVPSAITCARLLVAYVARRWRLDRTCERELGRAAEALVHYAVAAAGGERAHSRHAEVLNLIAFRLVLTPRAVIAEVWDSGMEPPKPFPVTTAAGSGCDLPRPGLRVVWCAICLEGTEKEVEAQTAAGFPRRQRLQGPVQECVAMRDPELLQRVLSGLRAFGAGEA